MSNREEKFSFPVFVSSLSYKMTRHPVRKASNEKKVRVPLRLIANPVKFIVNWVARNSNNRCWLQILCYEKRKRAIERERESIFIVRQKFDKYIWRCYFVSNRSHTCFLNTYVVFRFLYLYIFLESLRFLWN